MKQKFEVTIKNKLANTSSSEIWDLFIAPLPHEFVKKYDANLIYNMEHPDTQSRVFAYETKDNSVLYWEQDRRIRAFFEEKIRKGIPEFYMDGEELWELFRTDNLITLHQVK